MAFRSPKSVPTVARYASRPIALTNFHKPATRDEFTIAPRNCIIEVAAELAALGSAPLCQFAKSSQNGLWGPTTVPSPVPRRRLDNQSAAKASQ